MRIPVFVGKTPLMLMVLLVTGCPPSGPGGPVAGETDTHCGTTVVAIDPTACEPHQHQHDVDGGVDEIPEVRFNTEADDDDCKYRVQFSSTAVRANEPVTFTVEVTKKSDQQPAEGAAPQIEGVLSDAHPAPVSSVGSTETSPGKYTVGPVRFDASGRWTITVHLYDSCTDVEPSSPHSHVSFYFDVP